MADKRARTKEIEVIAQARAARLEMVASAAPGLTAAVGLVLILVTVPRVGGELGKLKSLKDEDSPDEETLGLGLGDDDDEDDF